MSRRPRGRPIGITSPSSSCAGPMLSRFGCSVIHSLAPSSYKCDRWRLRTYAGGQDPETDIVGPSTPRLGRRALAKLLWPGIGGGLTDGAYQELRTKASDAPGELSPSHFVFPKQNHASSLQLSSLSRPKCQERMMDWSDYYMNGDVEGYPPRPPSPKPARSGAFSYDDHNGLQASGISREPLSELRLLFRKNASRARQRVATKPWLTAQLRLYGITFDRSATADKLWDKLEAAVKGRMCVEGGPPSVTAVQERLAAEFARRREDYFQAVKRHKVDVEQWHKQSFDELDDPSAQARYDLDFFFTKYFLDDQGLPAPEKTPEPVVLWDLGDNTHGLRRRVDAVPGLSARVTQSLTVIAWAAALERGVEAAFDMIDRPDVKCDHPTLEASFDPDRFLAKYFLDGVRGKPAPRKQVTPLVLRLWVEAEDGLGRLSRAAEHVPELLVQRAVKPSDDSDWDCREGCVIVGWAKQVLSQVEAWKSEIARLEKQNTERQKRREEKAILAKLMPHIAYSRAHRPAPPSPFTLSHLVGSYIMVCRHLQEEYGVELGSMTLDVHAPNSTHGAVAAFDFGLVEGTMLLATSEDALESLRQEQDVPSSDEDDEMSPDIEYSAGSRKRKATDTGSGGPSSKHIKRQLGGDPPVKPGRFYLHWAGCETGNSYLVLDEDHERTGHFDLDKTGMTARGEFHWPGFFGEGERLVFTLLKVADTPRKSPDAWSSYCEKERWIHW
ncbi:hypothetical protein F4779DRAFT_617191 [Xylariaceae sp. FL0662B]|nr:hypothetical protein F4779DRAFT_617191 [Xylariaceae sp. FL0662B]